MSDAEMKKRKWDNTKLSISVFLSNKAAVIGLVIIMAYLVDALIAHELGHLAHQEWRVEANLPERPTRAGPYWSLYDEGFATRFEQEVTGRVRWPTKPGWLDWCQQNRAWLAANFMRAVQRRSSVRRFFGSWYRIRGHAECGYYLGHEVVDGWRQERTLSEIAIFSEEKMRRLSRQSLLGMAHSPTVPFNP